MAGDVAEKLLEGESKGEWGLRKSSDVPFASHHVTFETGKKLFDFVMGDDKEVRCSLSQKTYGIAN